jgi:hypothetical protein
MDSQLGIAGGYWVVQRLCIARLIGKRKHNTYPNGYVTAMPEGPQCNSQEQDK